MVASANPSYQNSAFIYPKRIVSLETLRPSYDRVGNNEFISNAYWPQGVDPQVLGPNDRVGRCVDFGLGGGSEWVWNNYYKISGYDVAEVPVAGSPGTTRAELRYAPFWSKYTVPTTCPSSVSGSPSDSTRQLGYTDPPESTVITWDSFFREFDQSGNPTRSGKRDIVLFLGGSARPMDSLDVSRLAWQVNP